MAPFFPKFYGELVRLILERSDVAFHAVGVRWMLGLYSAWIIRALRITSGHHRASQMAAAVAMGVFAGLVPKTNLLAVLLYSAALLLPIHNLLAIIISLIVTCGNPLFEPLVHRVGIWLLSHAKLQFLWEIIDSTPLLPWTGLTTSLVAGSTAIGLVLCYPAFLAAYPVFKRLAPGQALAPLSLAEEALAHPAANRKSSFEDSPITGQQRQSDSFIQRPHSLASRLQPHLHWQANASRPIEINSRKQLVALHQVADPLSRAGLELPDFRELSEGEFSDDTRGDYRSSISIDLVEPESTLDIAKRVARLAQWADEALSDCLREEIGAADSFHTDPTSDCGSEPDSAHLILQTTIPQTNIVDSDSTSVQHESNLKEQVSSPVEDEEPQANEEQWLVETTIEVVRLAEQAVANRRSRPDHRPSNEAQSVRSRSNPDDSREIHGSQLPPRAMFFTGRTQDSVQAQISMLGKNEQLISTTIGDSMTNDSSTQGLSTASGHLSGTGKTNSDSPANNSSSPASTPSLRINMNMISDAGQSNLRFADAAVPPGGNRDEALRYLLRHLHEIKERV